MRADHEHLNARRRDSEGHYLIDVVAFLVVVLLAAGCFARTDDSAHANVFEASYAAMAVNHRDARFCNLIWADAVVRAGGNPPGSQIYYQRAACFQRLAAFTGDETNCDEVRTLNMLFLDGGSFSEKNCRRLARSSPRPRHTVGGVQEELFLRLFGVIDSDAPATTDAVVKQYRQFESDGGLFRAFSRLPDFSESQEVALEQIRRLAPQCYSGANDRLCKLLSCATLRDDRNQAACLHSLSPPPI